MPATPSNHFLYQLAVGQINFSTDTCKAILMTTGFTFNRDTHATLADVSASELAGGNGYTAGGITLTGVTVTEDDPNDRCIINWNDAVWTASGGSIGPSAGCILYNDTTPDDTVIGFLQPGAEQTATDGNTMTVQCDVELS